MYAIETHGSRCGIHKVFRMKDLPISSGGRPAMGVGGAPTCRTAPRISTPKARGAIFGGSGRGDFQ